MRRMKYITLKIFNIKLKLKRSIKHNFDPRWEERHHNIPSGSELRWAYAWLNFTEDGRTYLPSDVATVDELWFDA